jgi:hypothetical protein
MSTQVSKKQLPSLTELYKDVQLVSQQNDLNILLNHSPKAEWVKEHPMATGVKYIPISIIEYLLTSIFVKWRVEVKETKVIANAIQVTIRLHVQDPISGEWDWQDGIGAAPIQTKKGASATDFTQVLTDAVVKAAPAAESYAVKDAAEKFGRLFGKDLNRKEFLPYTALEGKIDLSSVDITEDQQRELYALVREANLKPEEADQFQEEIAQGLSVADYQTMKRILIDKQVMAIDKVRNGDNVSMAEINRAVKERIS